ncbi:hypothetical protein [Arthrobacter sp. M4]|uniref:hypothetical protein n=1 Tax=Arthrobacter sp. M4 TaxID=218160 RepID=UPI001CDC83BC|nr:hypothetical protein [Arthrobacter sp. M4]MCA4133295.1 hypothetical protein [Arthrobacter sp. M4]
MLLRAVVALAFGALTIFWLQPSVQVLAWAMAAYLVATAVTLAAARSVPMVIAGVVGLCGVASAVTQSDAGVAASAASGLLVLGATEIVAGLRNRKRNALARDWLISGVIGVGTAALLPFFVNLGAHALLGVAGGGAVLTGVLWVLSGLSLRHDGRPAPAEAVN